MKKLLPILVISTIFFAFNHIGKEEKILNGIATDGYRNRVTAIHAIIKGTTNSDITDICGRFSIPIETDEFTIVFQGMTYDDTRTYEIRLKKSELKGDTIIFQLGHLKVENPDCKKVSKKLRRYRIE